MSATDEILSGIDMSDLASRVGADPETTRQAVEAAIPTLLASLQANVADSSGAESLFGALSNHAETPACLDDVDTSDGRQILKHMFADDPQRVQALAGQSGGLLAKLLPYLAPLVMSWLAKQVLGGNSGGNQQSDGGLLGGLLGGLFGGGDQQQAAPASGGGLGDILGQVLGGALGGTQAAPSGGTTPGQWQIPTTTTKQQGQQQSGGDLLGGLLGQILGGL
ncbi:MAG: DUF937 domain-containing protein [Propionicimonas sp.]|nr:DUF937 domain-containing protein [Propionicimonas sp.]